jgi:hypothetical protein
MSYTKYTEWLLIHSAKPLQLQTSRNIEEEAGKSEWKVKDCSKGQVITSIEWATLHNMPYTFHS